MRVSPRVLFYGGGTKIESSWDEPLRFATFDTKGALLNEVLFPVRGLVSFVGDFAWVLSPDDDDVPQLIKYKIRK